MMVSYAWRMRMKAVLSLMLAAPTVFSLRSPVSPLPSSQGNPQADSLANHVRAQREIVVFLARWREAWEESDATREKDPMIGRMAQLRSIYVHCHPQLPFEITTTSDNFADLVRANYAQIVSSNRRFAKCPTWLLGARSDERDEADSHDAPLLPRFVDSIVDRRTQLLALLDSLQTLHPADDWLSGQRVRFAMDAGDLRRAFTAASSCAGQAWWCTALKGAVAQAQGNVRTADSLLRASVRAMSATDRCAWMSIDELLPTADRDDYESMSCDQRVSLAERYFWLSDPILADSVNERLDAHLGRRILIALHAAVEVDERHDRTPARGGDAVAEMLMRYGWPTAAVWGGKTIDAAHSSYLRRSAHPAPPFSTAEYSLGRAHYAPARHALMHPDSARATDWELHSSLGEWSVFDSTDAYWWPQEHMRDTRRRMVALPAPGQVAMWRRQHDVRVAAVLDLGRHASADVSPMLSHVLGVSFVTSAAPDHFEIVAQRAYDLRDSTKRVPMLIDGVMRARDVIADIVVGVPNPNISSQKEVARVRWGISTPLPLDSLTRGAIALSDPALVHVDESGAIDASLEQMIPRLRANIIVEGARRVGVFWESYGVAPGDTVGTTVRVLPVSSASLLRRLTSAVHLTSDGQTSLVVSWKEPPRASRTASANDDVTISARTLVLDLSRANPGEYWLEISAASSSGATATARRKIEIR